MEKRCRIALATAVQNVFRQGRIDRAVFTGMQDGAPQSACCAGRHGRSATVSTGVGFATEKSWRQGLEETLRWQRYLQDVNRLDWLILVS